MTDPQQARPRAIILITLDALRADHLGCYGYPLPTSPFLDGLATESFIFEYAFSPVPLTTPAHTSILTGKYPRFHSVGFHNGDQPLSKEQEITLPQLLRQLGFRSAAFVSIGTLLKQTGLNSGFDLYDDTLPQRELNRPAEPRRSADLTTQAVLQWLSEHRTPPFFLWVHYGEPHGPYTPPPPYDSLFVGNQLYGAPRLLQTVRDVDPGGIPAYQVLKPHRDADGNLLDYEKDFTYYLAQYDGQIRFVDDQLKVLVDNLKEWGIYDDALLIVTADHGEALGENDIFFFHGLTVSLEQLHVPLIIKPPLWSRIKSRRITEPVSTIDIMPTLLAWLGEEVQYLGIQGMDLLPFLKDSRISLPRRYIFSEIPTQLSLIHSPFQLLYGKEKEDMPYPRVPAVEGLKLFDYIADPLGKRDISAQHPDIVAELKTTAEHYLNLPQPSYTTEQLSPEDMAEIKARLKQLGYIQQDAEETKPLLAWTGERFLPWMEGAQIHYEHLHRYTFAAQFVKGKRVLDLACGEGYGAQMLAEEAEYVIGIEIDRQTVEHARQKYMKNNLEFMEGSILAVPIKGEKLFDVIVCFEAIEHVAEHDKLLSEVKRLLKEDGIFIVSTPNKALYSDAPGINNPFHIKELYFGEFQELLKRYFSHVYIFGQRVYAGSNIWHLSPEKPHKYFETVIKKGDEEFHLAQRESKEPMYFVALASDAPLKPSSWRLDSWLVDTSNMLLHNYETQIAELSRTTQAKDAQRGIMMQLVSRYQRMVEKLLPWGTRRRYYYELVLTGIRVILNEGWRSFWLKTKRWLRQRISLFKGDAYKRWIAQNELSKEQLESQRQKSLCFKYRPKISIITPVWNTNEKWLRLAIDSVLNQTYDNWELCLADGNSTKSGVKKLLQEYAKRDSRIKIKLLPENKGTAGNSNEALSLATGEFVGFLDHDDELSLSALYEVVKLLNERPEADFVYSDEVRTDERGRPFYVLYKPDFSLDYMLSHPYIVHFVVVRKKLIEKVNGFREDFVTSHDYDLFLKLISKTRRVFHIPKVLYKWREHKLSAGHKYKDKVSELSKIAIRDFLKREGIEGDVYDGKHFNFFRVKRKILGNPRISIVIPTQDKATLLRRCIESIESKTTYRNYEVIIVNNLSKDTETIEYLDYVQKQYTNYKILKFEESFNFSRLNNYAVKHVQGEHLLFLNDDIEVISDEWLEAMLEHSQRDDVACVGAKLLFPDNRIQHAGVVVGLFGCCEHIYKFAESKNNIDYMGHLISIRNWSAVTGACMMVKKRVFDELGGFDENFKVNFGDIDFCLRALEKGYLNVYTPYAELYHIESATRKVFGFDPYLEDRRYFKQRWSKIIQGGDPYYNPNLPLGTLDITPYVELAWSTMPWLLR